MVTEQLPDRATLRAIEHFNAAFNDHDVDAVMAAMTDDCVFENTSPFPDGERITGQADVRAFWTEFFDRSPAAYFAAEETFACGDRAVVRWRYTWMNADGSPGHIRGVDIFRVQDGRIVVCVQHPGETDEASWASPASHWPDGGDSQPRPAVVAAWKSDGGRIGV